jgi:hypothetical protein
MRFYCAKLVHEIRLKKKLGTTLIRQIKKL